MTTSTKSLNEQVQDIRNSNESRATKARKLKKLGITDFEVHILLDFQTQQGTRTASQRLTFGVEIETYGMVRANLYASATHHNLNVEYQGYNHHDSNSVFRFVPDSSIRGVCPIECVTPILNNSKAGFKKLETCCKVLNEAGARVNRSTGLHVHIGSKTLTEKQYVNVFQNYKMLEFVIDSFMAISRRASNSQWCASLRGHNFDNCNTSTDVRRELNNDRYHKVNANSYLTHKTIEFRQHQGTTDFTKISKWVDFLTKLFVWSKDNKLTNYVESVDDIPFLTASEKAYFKARQEQLAQ